jgi:uncharacterized phage protein gp47/JayE
MQLKLQNFTTLVQNMAASVQSSALALIDLTTGSVLRAILEANASIALWLQWLIVQVLAQTRAATSTGADLDSWVNDFSLTRLPGQPATTNVTFSRSTTGMAASIVVGAQVKTADATQTFSVSADPTNAAYSALTGSYTVAPSVASITVPAQAVTSGTAGNVQAGAITLLASAMPGIDAVSNAAQAVGGMDAETDTALRARFANFIDSRSRATPAAIAFTIASLQQGLSFVLAENTDPSGAARQGFFTVTVDDGSGAPPATLISAVSTALDSVRPVGTQFAVQPPVLTIANVSLAVTTSTPTKTAAQSNVLSALTSYITALPIGAPLPVSRIAALAYGADPTVTNVSAISINGGGDLDPLPNGTIKPGTIAVN